MKNLAIVLCFFFSFSCARKLIETPEDLISEEKITNILYDLAVLNAAKNTNSAVLKKNGIEPIEFLYSKYEIDSLQFVESNRYYASLPDTYESIYKIVNARITTESEALAKAKKVKDSIEKAERKAKQKLDKAKKSNKSLDKLIDSLE